MTIDVATGISRILKQEGVGWVSTFPVCRVNNALGREGVPMLMMRDDRYAVAVADAFSPRGGTGSKYMTLRGVLRRAISYPSPAPRSWSSGASAARLPLRSGGTCPSCKQ